MIAQPDFNRLDDQTLMKLFQQGSEQAFDILVKRYTPLLAHFCRFSFYMKKQETEDLMQETFMRVYRNRFSYTFACKFSTWLYTILKNLCLSDYRWKKNLKWVTNELSNPDTVIEVEDLTAPDTGDHVERLEIQTAIQNGIANIPQPVRRVMELRFFGLMRYDEIAETLGIPVGTAKTQVHRGRKVLQTYLREREITP